MPVDCYLPHPPLPLQVLTYVPVTICTNISSVYVNRKAQLELFQSTANFEAVSRLPLRHRHDDGWAGITDPYAIADVSYAASAIAALPAFNTLAHTSIQSMYTHWHSLAPINLRLEALRHHPPHSHHVNAKLSTPRP